MRTTALGLSLLFFTGVAFAQDDTQEAAQKTPDPAAQARAIAGTSLIVDTHIDMPYRLKNKWADVASSAPDREFDFPRAVMGGLNVPFMSIYTPAAMEESGGSYELANQLIDSVEALVGRAPGKFSMAYTADHAEEAGNTGQIALALGMENGSPIEGKLENLEFFYDRGIRYITLAHSLSNHISDSSYDPNRVWGGLSPFGREVVAEMNRLGMMVDISHVSDEAFYDVLEVTKVPVIASHSSARHFTKEFERNMSGEMIQALAEQGGVIMINFGSTFVTQEARNFWDDLTEKRTAWAEETGNESSGDEARAWLSTYMEQYPLPFANVSEVADHFDYVVNLVGVEYVGIGSDYDGVGDSLPDGLKDVSTYPNLIEELLRRGYSEEDIRAILGGNLMRVWRANEEFAAQAQES